MSSNSRTRSLLSISWRYTSSPPPLPRWFEAAPPPLLLPLILQTNSRRKRTHFPGWVSAALGFTVHALRSEQKFTVASNGRTD